MESLQSSQLDPRGLVTMQDLMEALQLAMADEYDKLEDEWNHYHCNKAIVDHLLNRIQSIQCIPEERLRMNISGNRFEINASLCVSNSAFFRSLKEGKFSKIDSDGFYFIDRDPSLAHVIFSFLRHGRVDLEIYTEVEITHIKEDAEFFMLGNLVRLIDYHSVKTHN